MKVNGHIGMNSRSIFFLYLECFCIPTVRCFVIAIYCKKCVSLIIFYINSFDLHLYILFKNHGHMELTLLTQSTKQHCYKKIPFCTSILLVTEGDF